jgi:hypothetical protein
MWSSIYLKFWIKMFMRSNCDFLNFTIALLRF